MRLSADERRSVLGVLAAAQLTVFLLLLLPPPAFRYLVIPFYVWAGWDRYRAVDVGRAVVETQQWIAWMVEFDSRLMVTIAALTQMLLATALICYVRLGWRLNSALALCAVVLALLAADNSRSVILGDRLYAPLLFCLAYVTPVMLDGLRSRGVVLTHLTDARRPPLNWQYGLRGLLIAVFAASLLIALASSANAPLSPRWLSAISNGLFMGIAMWVALRVLLSPGRLWMGLPLLALALATSHFLLLFNTWTYGSYVPLFGTHWLSIYAMSQSGMLTGLARLMAWNLTFVALSVTAVRICGYRLVKPSEAQSAPLAVAAPVTAVLGSASF